MNNHYRKIVIGGFATLAALSVLLGWQPIRAAAGKIYYSVAPNSGLIGYWSFDDCDSCTTAKDYSGNTAPGDLTGGVTRTSTTRVKGNAMDFNGSTGYIQVSDDADWAFGTGDFTMSTWVNFDTIRAGGAGSAPNVFIAQDEGSGTTNKWVFYLADSTTLYFHINGPVVGSTFITGATFSPSTGQWYHVAVTRSGGSSYTFYVNGEQRSTATDSKSIPDANIYVSIGQTEGIGYLDGKQDEIRIYNRAISAGEVKHLYEQARSKTVLKPPALGGLAGYWNFDDCDTCTTAKDYSGNGNDGTTYASAGPTVGDLHTKLGKIGNSLTFDGTNDFVQIADASSLKPTSVTVSAWVNFTSLTSSATCGGAPNTLQYLVFKRNTRTSADEGYALLKYIDGSSNPQFDFTIASSGGVQTSAGSVTIPTTNRWYHLVGTFEQPTMNLYVDGKLESTATHNFALDHHTRPVFIGRTGECGGAGEANFDAYANAKIDEVRIYNRALIADEVKNLYQNTSRTVLKAPTMSGLVGYWNFDDCDACTTAKDYIGSAPLTLLGSGATPTDLHTVSGRSGRGISLNGSNQYAQSGAVSALQITGDATVSVWANYTALNGGDTYENVMIEDGAVGEGSAANFLYYLNIRTNKILGMFWENGNGGNNSIFSTVAASVNANEWHHYAATRDSAGKSLIFYVDGAQLGDPVSYANNPDGGTSGTFGGGTAFDSIGTENFSGKLDEMRVYNRVLTAAEIKEIYRSGK